MYQSKDNVDTREIRRGEIYFIDLSDMEYANSHISGKSRPGLVIQNNIGNDNSNNVIIALITSADKRPYPFQYKIDLNGRSSTIMFDQIITVPKINLNNKIGELMPQQMIESDSALMCSLDLISYSIASIKDFNILSVITERTKDKEIIKCAIEITIIIGDRENTKNGVVNLMEISKFDSSITKDTDLAEIKSKLNNCAGLNFIANNIQF